MPTEEFPPAATLNAAAALGLAGELGTLEPGKRADFVVWDAQSFREIPYWMGQNLAWAVIKNGALVFRVRDGEAKKL